MITLLIDESMRHSPAAQALTARFGGDLGELTLHLTEAGLSLEYDGASLLGDFAHLLPRVSRGLGQELLLRAARIKEGNGPFTAFDATAGLGEDSFVLAAGGFQVTLYEQNPVIFALLSDAHRRALADPALAPIASRMTIREGDSVAAMAAMDGGPDVILLDPMFPARQKSALVKKKLQLLQKLERPCGDERTLLLTAARLNPRKLIVKRPPKGPYLADIKPDYAIEGKAVRFDCFAAPGLRDWAKE